MYTPVQIAKISRTPIGTGVKLGYKMPQLASLFLFLFFVTAIVEHRLD